MVDEFTQDLRSALHGGVDTLTPQPTLLPLLRKRYARRVAMRRAGFVAGPLAVAAIVAAAVALPGTPASAPAVQDVAYVTARVTQALDAAGQDVVYSTQTRVQDGKTVVYEYWTTPDSSVVRKRTTIDGTLTDDTKSAPDGGIVVEYGSRTWYREPARDPAQKVIVAQPFPSPAAIEEQLAKGYLEVVGKGENIGGQPTTHLRKTATAPKFKKGENVDVIVAEFTELWVSETDYLPVRTRDQSPVDDQTDDFKWLPPTPDNLALLDPPVPPDFKEVPAR